jgi:xanthine dehydrogenase YagS FAD-binding subunit
VITNFSYVRPGTLRDAISFLSAEGVRLSAGGTDLLGCLRDEVFDAKMVVSLGGLKGLKGITEVNGIVRIGALTTITEVAEHPLLRERYAGLAEAAESVASPQLRNQGTIGGTLCQKPRCWYYRGEFHCLRKGGDRCFARDGQNQYHCVLGGGPCYIVHPSDVAAALVAFDARISAMGPGGKRTLPAAGFHVLPGVDVRRETVLAHNEIVTEILLPSHGVGTRSSYRKVMARRSWDFAVAGVALVLNLEGERVRKARVVLSGAAPVPWRSREAEEVIAGSTLRPGDVSKAADAAMKNAIPLAHNGYKVPLFRGMIEEELAAYASFHSFP